MQQSDMLGQWTGSLNGTNRGVVVLNRELSESSIYLADSSAPILWNLYACIDLQSTGTDTFTGRLSNFHFYDPETNQLKKSECVIRNSPELKDTIPIHGSVEAKYQPQQGGLFLEKSIQTYCLEGTWKTNIGTLGSFEVTKASQGFPYPPDKKFSTWREFKEWCDTNRTNNGYVYRGQKDSSWNLMTTWHRKGRCDHIRYLQQDVTGELAHHIHAMPGYLYDTNKADDLFALVHLAQHHGFPTPLLDWTESPYIAAYFAYATIEKKQVMEEKSKDKFVRIFAFDTTSWQRVGETIKSMYELQPTVTFKRLPARNNNRALAQQSISSFSNLMYMEYFIAVLEKRLKEKFLHRIDLPVQERNNVMTDLKLMGITSATMFPGIEGICKALEEQRF